MSHRTTFAAGKIIFVWQLKDGSNVSIATKFESVRTTFHSRGLSRNI